MSYVIAFLLLLIAVALIFGSQSARSMLRWLARAVAVMAGAATGLFLSADGQPLVGALIGGGAVAALLVAQRVWVNSLPDRAFRRAQAIGVPSFQLWASRAPFDDGTHSALMLSAAIIAVDGLDTFNTLGAGGAIQGHRDAYDADPAGWEETARKALAQPSQVTPELEDKFQEAIVLVRDLLAGDAEE